MADVVNYLATLFPETYLGNSAALITIHVEFFFRPNPHDLSILYYCGYYLPIPHHKMGNYMMSNEKEKKKERRRYKLYK
jgi:hypothetical protein